MAKSRALPSKQRTNVIRAYRSRGRANRNLWLVYSPKTDRGWILGSDRHLVHWILLRCLVAALYARVRQALEPFRNTCGTVVEG
jgi:hypothetical protein